jgi:hypothetical protein
MYIVPIVLVMMLSGAGDQQGQGGGGGGGQWLGVTWYEHSKELKLPSLLK